MLDETLPEGILLYDPFEVPLCSLRLVNLNKILAYSRVYIRAINILATTCYVMTGNDKNMIST